MRLVTQCVPLLCWSRTLPLGAYIRFLAPDILLVYIIILSYCYTGMVVVSVLSIWVQCPVWGLSGVSLTVHSHWVMGRGHAPMAWMSGLSAVSYWGERGQRSNCDCIGKGCSVKLGEHNTSAHIIVSVLQPHFQASCVFMLWAVFTVIHRNR